MNPDRVLVVGDLTESSISGLKEFCLLGEGVVVLPSHIEKGRLPFSIPDNIQVVDLRYQGGFNVVRGNHPRIEGIWTQYSHLNTGLARNIVISHTISDETKIENWKSDAHEMQLAPYGAELASEDYKHQHNHYQNLLCETFNFSADLNAVSIWGDSGAFVPGAKSWGAFFSARSWPVKWTEYTPESVKDYADKDFDAALVGVEIDVLNAGLPWGETSSLLTSSMAKVGIQVVGFGKKNTAALEIRTEDSDDPTNTPETRRGAWHWGIIMRNCLAPQSTVLNSENGRIAKGIDFDKTTFTDGALRISGDGVRSGIVFDDGQGGEIYSEVVDGRNILTIAAGSGGIRIVDQSGQSLLKSGASDAMPLIARPANVFGFEQSEAYRDSVERQTRFNAHLRHHRSRISRYISGLAERLKQDIFTTTPSNLFCLQIPFCSDVGIDYRLQESFGDQSKVFFFNGLLTQLEETRAGTVRPESFVIGHAPVGVEKHFDGSFSTIAQVRDGFERLVSEYYSADPSRSFESFVSTLQTWQINPQTKYLSGNHPVVQADETDLFEAALDNVLNNIWITIPVEMSHVLLSLASKRFGWSAAAATSAQANIDALKLADSSTLRARVRPFYFADQAVFDIVKAAWDIVAPSIPRSVLQP